MAKRTYGTGRLYEKHGSWYGSWRVTQDQRVNRKVGPIRQSGGSDGLTRNQAERKLRQMMERTKPVATPSKVTFKDAAERHIDRLETLGRKRSTIEDYRGYLRVHLEPAFGHMLIEKIIKADIERFMYAKLKKGLSPKSVINYMGLLHGVLGFAMKQEWISTNPAKLVDKPKVIESNPDFKFLNLAEIDRLLKAVPDDQLGQMEQVLYLAGAMTGLRQGELLGLRWGDIDWTASVIRVRQNYVRGEFGTPKSVRGSRAVPLALDVARELELHSRRSAYTADGDLALCHPQTGRPYDRSKLLKRFKEARDKAGVTPITFNGLRHTFGTRMAAAGVAMRTLQEWMGHRDFATTLKYAHYAPGHQQAELVARAFGGFQTGSKEDSSAINPDQLEPTL